MHPAVPQREVTLATPKKGIGGYSTPNQKNVPHQYNHCYQSQAEQVVKGRGTGSADVGSSSSSGGVEAEAEVEASEGMRVE